MFTATAEIDTAATRFDHLKRITPVVDRSGRRPRTEFDASFDEVYLGTFRSHEAAQNALDDYAWDMLTRELL